VFFTLKFLDVTKSISDQLNCDLKTKEISSLCVDIDNDNFRCIHLSIDKLPRDMIEHFIVFGNKYKSKLFELIWEEKESQFCDKQDLTGITFSDIHKQVWTPTMKSCKNLLHKLCDKSFTYSDIKNFAHVGNIEDHVIALYNAMHQCYPAFVSSLSEPQHWIPQAVKNITLYQDFASNTDQVNVVKLCLKTKELLRVKGDFSVVYNLDSEVSFNFIHT